MLGVNKVILIGNLGDDPKKRSTQNGIAVANFPIAVTERYKDKNGQRQENTEWHNIVCWNKLADLASEYLKKGSSVYIEGKISTRKWQDKDGNNRFKVEIIAKDMTFLSSKDLSKEVKESQQKEKESLDIHEGVDDLPF